ncbi:hypothetical protein [Blastopirellula marina]|uniref:PH domain-containing protein n=1 Tax=Blastopirellula marina TaxID=124 RepID=A0A2S8GRE9_9BACT|nr:hypothetical protein [Blastopirellula marina]PQO47000.1 hypothetical protein C5Y93_05745 [Blastopirellula marina]
MSPSSREYEHQSPELTLVRLPIRDDHIAQAAVAVLLIVLGVLTYSETVGLWISLAVVLMSLAASWKLFIPVRFELGPRGIIQTSFLGTRKTPWREIARYEVHPQGVILYQTHDHSPLAGFTSIDLACRGMKGELESVVHFYMEARRMRTGSSIVRMAEDSSPSQQTSEAKSDSKHSA